MMLSIYPSQNEGFLLFPGTPKLSKSLDHFRIETSMVTWGSSMTKDTHIYIHMCIIISIYI
jgi:hypothetical protein